MELLHILMTPVGGDARLILADELIAAGSTSPTAPTRRRSAAQSLHADSLLSAFSGKLPYNVKPSSATGQMMVRYDQVNAMLLNEFLKEHRKNEEQKKTIVRLQKQVEALTAGLQNVSALIRMSRPAPQVALNNQ